jgi:pyruvate dehydrogenase E2 component (dihydrolipoamide acetyltransferase)
MGETTEVLVPDIGDFDEVDVIEVLVSAGDQVKPEDSLITLESDKATMDVPSPLAGTVRSVKVKAGDRVGQGALILTLEVSEEAPATDEQVGEGLAPSRDPEPTDDSKRSEGDSSPSPAPEVPAAEAPPAPEPAPQQAIDPTAFTKAYASPSVRRFARELGVDLSRVQGTGRKARILKEDVQKFIKGALVAPAAGGPSLPEIPVIDFTRFGDIDRVELSRIQRISGPRLQASWVNLPHVTQNDEADVTDLEAFRKEQKGAAKEQGVSLTPLAFIMKATVRALEEYPALNASLDPGGEHLILKRYYHLGFAVDTTGGLVVPVIRDVDKKGVLDVARELGEISAVAREGKLKPDQIQGASFTISSLGSIGGSFFSPIVNAPEVGILGVARSRVKPVWNGSEFEPRLMLPLSLSYDHRVVDGAMAVRFTSYLTHLLSDIRRLML